MSTTSPIAETARLEAATETLAEYIGYLNGEIDSEQEKASNSKCEKFRFIAPIPRIA